jgi:hypothetical protein
MLRNSGFIRALSSRNKLKPANSAISLKPVISIYAQRADADAHVPRHHSQHDAPDSGLGQPFNTAMQELPCFFIICLCYQSCQHMHSLGRGTPQTEGPWTVGACQAHFASCISQSRQRTERPQTRYAPYAVRWMG